MLMSNTLTNRIERNTLIGMAGILPIRRKTQHNQSINLLARFNMEYWNY